MNYNVHCKYTHTLRTIVIIVNTCTSMLLYTSRIRATLSN